MPSPSCQQNPRPPASPALIADLALPAVPVVREYLLNTSFIAARVRLVSLISEGSLVAASIEAYASSLLKLAGRVPADALASSALIAVRISEPTDAPGMVAVPLRWHATGTGGQPVRVLGADLTLIAGRAGRTLLQLHGAFRLPFVLPGADAGRDRVAQRAAAASVTAFVGQVRQHLAVPAGSTGT
jgi:hypothetical protein